MQKVSGSVSGVTAASFRAGMGRRLYLLSSLTAPTVNEDGTSVGWVHLAPFGSWKGHDKGAFKFDRATFENIIREFEKIANDVQIDYNHDSLAKEPGMKPAAGWIKKLEIRGTGANETDGLWAYVRWTKRATQYIASAKLSRWFGGTNISRKLAPTASSAG